VFGGIFMEMRETKNIDKLFHDKLEGFERDIPNYVWDNITGELNNGKKRKRFIYFRNLAAAAAIVLAFCAGYYVTRLNFNGQPVGLKNSGIVENRQNIQTESPSTKNADNTLTKRDTSKQQSDSTINNYNPNRKIIETAIAVTYGKANKTKTTNQEVLAATNKQDVFPVNGNNTLATNEIYFSPSNTFATETDSMKIDFALPIFSSLEKLPLASALAVRTIPDKKLDTAILKQLPLPLDEMASVVTGEDDNEKAKWSIGGAISPMYSGNISLAKADMDYYAYPMKYMSDNALSLNNSNDVYQKAATVRYNSEQRAMVTYSGGINVRLQKNKRFSFQSGLFLTKRGVITDNLVVNELATFPSNVFATNTAVSDIVFDQLTSSELASLKTEQGFYYQLSNSYFENGYRNNVYKSQLDLLQQFQYLEIPVIAKYKIIDRKIDVLLSGGFSTNILIQNAAIIEYENKEFWKGKSPKAESFIYDASFGFDFEWALFRKLSLQIEPAVKYAFLNKNTQIGYYPMSFVFYTGVRYAF